MATPSERKMKYYQDKGLTYLEAMEHVRIDAAENKPQDFSSLLQPIFPDPATMNFMLINYASQVNAIAGERNSEAAKVLYQKCLRRIKTTTKSAICAQFDGLAIDGDHPFSTSLKFAFADTIPKLLKTLSESEGDRVSQFPECGFVHPNIVQYELVKANGRQFMLMEIMSATLEQYPGFTTITGCDSFCRCMLEGLKYLHSLGYAHFDLKPSNVGITNTGEFKLIDLGSVSRLGTSSEATTDAFLPSNMVGRKGDVYNVNEQHDFYMLVCTLLHKCGKFTATGPAPTREQVVTLVRESSFAGAEHVAALLALLNPTTAPPAVEATTKLPSIK